MKLLGVEDYKLDCYNGYMLYVEDKSVDRIFVNLDRYNDILWFKAYYKKHFRSKEYSSGMTPKKYEKVFKEFKERIN